MRRIMLVSVILVAVLLTTKEMSAQADTLVQVGTIGTDGTVSLSVQESILKSAYEIALNDGTVMSQVFIYDTLGTYYLFGKGINNAEGTFGTYTFILYEDTDSLGNTGLFVYAVASAAADCISKCLCTDCQPRAVSPGDPISYCDCMGRNQGPCPGEGEEEDYWCQITSSVLAVSPALFVGAVLGLL